MKAMRWGYSTGTCAAAGSKAALIRLLQNRLVESVRIELPDGHLVGIPVAKVWRTENGGVCAAVGVDISYPEDKIFFTTLEKLAEDDADYRNSIMVIFNEG